MSSVAFRAIKSAIYFLIFGCLWILFSDRIVDYMFDYGHISMIQSYKGVFFVLITSGFIYFLISNEIKRERTLYSQLQSKAKALEELQIKDEQNNLLLKDTILQLEHSYVELKNSQTMYRTYINNSNEGIYRFQLRTPLDVNLSMPELVERIFSESCLDEYNLVFASLYGLPDLDLIRGKSLSELVPEVDREQVHASIEQFVVSDFNVSNYETELLGVGNDVKVILNNTIGIIEDGKLVMIWGTQSNITDRKKAENELVLAKVHAEESDKLKSSFLANMSHEIRTPLNGIIGFAEMLIEDDIEPDQKERFVQIIQNNSNQLLRIISDILDISKLETDQLIINNKPLSLNELIEEIGLYLENEVAKEGKNVAVVLEKGLEQDEDWIVSDKQRLYQVITNLSNNALKFTKTGSITIGYELKEDQLHFSVKDTGLGIPKEKQFIVFDRFRQIEGESNRKYGGAGLGLAISKGIVEVLGGQISFSSTEGEGTEFYFHIPLVLPS